MNENFKELLEQYSNEEEKSSQSVLVSLIRESQSILGHLGEKELLIISESMGVKPSYLSAIIKKIPSLRSQCYRHKIICCSGERCIKSGGMGLLQKMEVILGVKTGEITPDNRFFLTTQICLKHCRLSPNMQIDGTVFTQLNEEKIKKILADFS